MTLSVANIIAWDFTVSLDSQIGQAETVSLSGSAARDNTDGIQCYASGDGADVTCTNGGYLVGWAFPYSMLVVLRCPRTGTTGGPHYAFMRTNSGATRLLGLDIRYDTGVMRAIHGNPVDAQTSQTCPNNSETVMLVEFTATGTKQWYMNGGSITTGTPYSGGSYSMPTLNTTDVIRIPYPHWTIDPNTNFYGAALIPGATTSDDRDALAADWRAALFDAAAAEGVVGSPINRGIITSLVNGGLAR